MNNNENHQNSTSQSLEENNSFVGKLAFVLTIIISTVFVNNFLINTQKPDFLKFTKRLKACKSNTTSTALKRYNFNIDRSWLDIEFKYTQILEGNYQNYKTQIDKLRDFTVFEPEVCSFKQCVAFLIPARNREKHLQQLLYYLPEILLNQKACFGIYVLDQYDDKTLFNKAKLYNAGFLEARKDKDWDCYVFHDVDLLLQNQTIKYECSSNKTKPVHMSVAISKYQYFFTNTKMIGGVSLFTEKGLKMVNGWSNDFWGWGGEDDNMFHRLESKNIQVERPSFDCFNPIHVERNLTNCAMWQMIFHLPDKSNPLNKNNSKKVDSKEGLKGGLDNVDYFVRKKELKLEGLYSYLLIDLNAPELNEENEEKVVDFGGRTHG